MKRILRPIQQVRQRTLVLFWLIKVSIHSRWIFKKWLITVRWRSQYLIYLKLTKTVLVLSKNLGSQNTSKTFPISAIFFKFSCITLLAFVYKSSSEVHFYLCSLFLLYLHSLRSTQSYIQSELLYHAPYFNLQINLLGLLYFLCTALKFDLQTIFIILFFVIILSDFWRAPFTVQKTIFPKF